MLYLGVTIWLISAALSYGVNELAVLWCDRRQWTQRGRIAIAVWSLLLGPFALVIALETLFFVEMAEGLSHRL